MVECTASLATNDAVARLLINDTEVFTASVSVTGVGFYTAYSTQAVGVDTFDAGDRLQFKFTPGGMTTEANSCIPLMYAELEFGFGEVLKLGEDADFDRVTPIRC
jgi:hypothetical protein